MEKYTSLYYISIYIEQLRIGVYHYPSDNEQEWETYTTSIFTKTEEHTNLYRSDTLSNLLSEIRKYTYTDRTYSIKVTFENIPAMCVMNEIILDEVHHDDDWLTLITDAIHNQWVLDYGSRMVKSARK